MMAATKETAIVRAILQALSYRKDVVAWRQNTGAVKSEYKGKTRFVRFSIPGAADITGLVKGGRRLEIEVKRPGNKPTPEQLVFGENILSMGGIWFWTISVADCLEQLDREMRCAA